MVVEIVLGKSCNRSATTTEPEHQIRAFCKKINRLAEHGWGLRPLRTMEADVRLPYEREVPAAAEYPFP